MLCVQRELRHLSQSWQHIRKRHHKLQIGTHQQEERKELLVCWRRVTWAGPKEPRVTEEAGSHEPMAETGTFFFFFFFFFYLWWILSYIEMKQPRVYMCSPSQSPLPPPSPPIPSGFPSAPGPSTCLMHPTWAGDLFHPR